MSVVNQDLHRPAGYTLLEMLILVALVALVAGLSWPSLRRLSQKRELLEAARQVRVELLRTRLDAIQSGSPRQFRCQFGTGFFESAAFQSIPPGGQQDDWADVMELPIDSAAAEGPLSSSPPEDAATLPRGLSFVDPAETVADVAEAFEQSTDDELTEPDDAAWSPPVVFYPNGRTLNARFRLTNGAYAVDLTLRGLTGTARIGQVQRLVDDQSLGDELP